jgi:hypothetical protein
MSDIYKQAAQIGLTFPSAVGDLYPHQLWQLPLTKRRGQLVDLEDLGSAVTEELDKLGERSFVKRKPDPRRGHAELRLAILEDIRDTKLAQEEAAKRAAEDAELEQKLLAALADKEASKLAGMSEDDIRARLAEIKARKAA